MKLANVVSYIWQHPLNRNGRTAALVRFAKWQMRSRLTKGKLRVPFVEGTQLAVSRGMTGATGNIYCGLHEPDDMGFVLHMLRPGDFFADVGANVGSYSVLAAGAAGADAIAFEPVPFTFADLQENIAVNQLQGRVEVRNEAVGASASSIRFSAAMGPMNHVMADGEEIASIEVPVVALDIALNGRVPIAMKVDVEGFEGAVLEGGPKTFADERLLAVVMEIGEQSSRYGYNEVTLRQQIKDAGFVTCAYDATKRELTVRAADFGSNTIFVKDIDRVRERLTTAPRYRLCNGTI